LRSEQQSQRASARSRAKVHFVPRPGLLLGNAALLLLLLLTIDFSLGSFLLVQPDRFDDSRPGHAIQRFRNNKHSKSRLVRGREEVERVRREFATRDDLYSVVIDEELQG